MARVELPESRLRLRKRRRRVRVALLLCLLLLVVVAALVAAMRIAAIQVRTVSVSGAQTLSSTTIEAFVRARLQGTYWYVFPKSNIFLYPKAGIRSELTAHYPVLASVDVHAGDFHTVVVNLVERQPRALWCPSATGPIAGCFFVDENGAVYAEAPIFSEPVYTVYTGVLSGEALPKHYLAQGEFQALSALVDAIVQKLSDEKLSAVSVDNDNDVAMRFADASPAGGQGFVLKFALHDEGGDVFERLTLALTAEPIVSRKLSDFEYLDLRFGDKLYYKLK